MKLSYKSPVFTPIVLAIAIGVGLVMGRYLSQNSNNSESNFSKNFGKLDMVLDYVESEYVDTIKPSELIEKSLPVILENLDPHSVYIPAKELLNLNESLEGNFEGIGVQFNIQRDTIMVINVVNGGPSEKEGVMPGDRIVKINDTIVAGVGITNNKVLETLKGPKGTQVNISVFRKGIPELLEFTITRDKIPLHSIDVAYMISESIGYFKISNFSSTTYKEFKKEVLRLKKQGLKKIIIDLRGNGGGYLDAATKICDEFLSDKKVIVYTEGKARPKTITYATSRGYCESDEVIVLIDEWSASASEIFAGAIQDNDRGIIIGRRSFGKGLVQEQNMLPDGSAIRLTIARYYTPTGRCIQKPYNNGYNNYMEEITERYLNGEMEIKDSIKISDTTKYITPEGKILYGGGGIMPDIFIPIDTLGWTRYLANISNRGLIYQFAFNYVDENRDFLQKFKDFKVLNDFLDKAHLINQFIVFAEDKGVEKNYKEIKTSEVIIKTQIKAYISRNLFDDAGFYPIIKDVDLPLKRAIEIFNNSK